MRLPRISTLCCVAAILAAASPLAAQRKELTVFGGANLSGASGADIASSESRTGWQFGANIRLPHSPRLSFQAGLVVVQRRFAAARAPSTLPPLIVGPRQDEPELLFAQIPLMLRFERGYSTERPVRPYFLFGGYVGVRLHCFRRLTEASGAAYDTDCSISGKNRPVSTDPYVPARYQDLDAGFLAEVGVEVKRFSLGVRGVRGMGNVIDAGAVPSSPLDRAKLWTVAVSVEYLLKVL